MKGWLLIQSSYLHFSTIAPLIYLQWCVFRDCLQISLLLLCECKWINFCHSWNSQKTIGFLMISGGEVHWRYFNLVNIRNQIWRRFLKVHERNPGAASNVFRIYLQNQKISLLNIVWNMFTMDNQKNLNDANWCLSSRFIFNLELCSSQNSTNLPILAQMSIFIPPENVKNLWLSDISMGYRNGALG